MKQFDRRVYIPHTIMEKTTFIRFKDLKILFMAWSSLRPSSLDFCALNEDASHEETFS